MAQLYEKSEKGALVPATGEIPEEAITAIERADEDTIVERLTRVDAQPFFAYCYPVKTKDGIKDIIGIGVDGAKEIARQLCNIRVSTELRIEDRDDRLYSVVPVTDLSRNVTLLGVASQSKYILGEGWAPTDRLDEHAFVKSVNKAQRNGILAIAPQLAIADIIAKLDPRAIKRLSGPPSTSRLPAVIKGPVKKTEPEESQQEREIKSLRQQLHVKWDELRKLDAEVGDKKDWLKERYKAESSVELSLEQLKEAIQNVGAEITLKAGPQSTFEERKVLYKEIMDFYSQQQSHAEASKKTQEMFTQGKGGRTQQDLESIRAKLAELKQPQAGNADAEGEAFLKEHGD